MRIFIGILLLVLLIGGIIWSTISMMKQSAKDWETLRELQEKSKNVKTKEEIEELYKELREKGSKIHNKFIYPHLVAIDGYLKGMYQQYKTK